MRLIALAGSLVAVCSLTACGGGGTASSGPVTSTPTPTPSPTPAQVNASLVTLQYAEAFEARAAVNPVTISKTTGNLTVPQSMSLRQMEVRYNPAGQTYTIVTGDYPDMSFGTVHRDAVSSNATLSVYEQVQGATTDNFVLFNPGPGNPQLALTYTSYGAWQRLVDTGSAFDLRTIFITFGLKTTAADLPKTGSAAYTSRIDGFFTGTSGAYALEGASSFSADFAAGTVAFSMTPVGTHILNGSSKSFGTLTGAGTITAALASFSADTGPRAAPNYGANVLGAFYGPAAAEFGATFTILGPDGQGNGAFVGKKN